VAGPEREAAAQRVRAGLVLTGLGDDSPPSYKRSRRGDALVDRAASHVLAHADPVRACSTSRRTATTNGSSARPASTCPSGGWGEGVHGEYPEYHTSADDLDFVRAERLGQSYELLRAVLDVVSGTGPCATRLPSASRSWADAGSTGTRGHADGPPLDRDGLLWVLNLSDGCCSLLDIAQRAQLPFSAVPRQARAARGRRAARVSTWAVVLAAGSGRRFGTRKQFLRSAGCGRSTAWS
jgi:aminopeptidase-like protein